MPDVERLSVDLAVEAAEKPPISAFRSLPFFQTPAHLRSADGSEAFNADNLVRATQAISRRAGDRHSL